MISLSDISEDAADLNVEKSVISITFFPPYVKLSIASITESICDFIFFSLVSNTQMDSSVMFPASSLDSFSSASALSSLPICVPEPLAVFLHFDNSVEYSLASFFNVSRDFISSPSPYIAMFIASEYSFKIVLRPIRSLDISAISVVTVFPSDSVRLSGSIL